MPEPKEKTMFMLLPTPPDLEPSENPAALLREAFQAIAQTLKNAAKSVFAMPTRFSRADHEAMMRMPF
jgi:hypothetical protein